MIKTRGLNPFNSVKMEYSRKYFSIAALAAAAIIVPLLVGMPVTRAEGTCYVKNVRCHGLAVDGCLGVKETSYNYEPKDQCSAIQNITRECNRIGEKLAEQNNGSIGTSWASLAQVEGRSCEEWRQVYAINLTSY